MAKSVAQLIPAALLCLTLAACEQTTPEIVDLNRPAPQCFQASDFRTWRAPDNKTIFIRAGLRNFYRLDLAGSCPSLTSPGSFLVTTFRGPTTICSNLDWDLKVSDTSSFPIPCIVEKMTPLTPAQAAQIPDKYKP